MWWPGKRESEFEQQNPTARSECMSDTLPTRPKHGRKPPHTGLQTTGGQRGKEGGQSKTPSSHNSLPSAWSAQGRGHQAHRQESQEPQVRVIQTSFTSDQYSFSSVFLLQEKEGEDEFDNFYRQYRSHSGGGYQGGIREVQSVRGLHRVPSEHIRGSGFQRAPSQHSGSISGTSRASLPRSMFGGFVVRQEQGSLWGGGSTSVSYASCTNFTTNGYQSKPPPARNPFLSRSRSQGRDPRLTDLFRAGYGRDAEDTLSRDSGCSIKCQL